ncbi:InlB B-repeat-containing protein [Treponema sp. R80B11-R83G3]
MVKINDKIVIKPAWRIFPLIAALFLVMTACGHDPFFIPVASIKDVPETGVAGTPIPLTGKVSPSFASYKSIVWLVENAGTTEAGISGNILNTKAKGIVSLRATVKNGIAEGMDYTQDFFINIKEGDQPVLTDINSIDIIVTGPGTGETPDTYAFASESGVSYAVGEVSWSPVHDTFQGNTAYTSTVTVTANEGNKFVETPSAKINGHTAAITNSSDKAVTLSLLFDPTLANAVKGIEIIGQPKNTEYAHGDTLDLTGLRVKLIYTDNTDEEFDLINFGTNISTNPAQGARLIRTEHNGHPITVSVGRHSAITDVLLTVNKAAGAAVGTPVVTLNTDNLSITVTPITSPANGQSIEYAKNTSTAVPETGWQDGTTFGGLSANTPYYIFARSKENANYNAGTPSVSEKIMFYTVTFESNGGGNVPSKNIVSGGTVTKPADPTRTGYKFDGWYKESGLITLWNFTNDTVTANITLYAKWLSSQGITFEFNPDNSPSVNSGIVIHRSSENGATKATLTISDYDKYTGVEWYYNDIILGDEASLTLDSSDYQYNMIGTKFVRVEAMKGGVPYITNVEFRVEP